jgi:hypothetical protein
VATAKIKPDDCRRRSEDAVLFPSEKFRKCLHIQNATTKETDTKRLQDWLSDYDLETTATEDSRSK